MRVTPNFNMGETPQDMADFVEYVNGPAELVPYAKAAVERWRYEPTRLYNPYTGRRDST